MQSRKEKFKETSFQGEEVSHSPIPINDNKAVTTQRDEETRTSQKPEQLTEFNEFNFTYVQSRLINQKLGKLGYSLIKPQVLSEFNEFTKQNKIGKLNKVKKKKRIKLNVRVKIKHSNIGGCN